MIRVSLDRAAECLTSQTPKDYVGQLAAASRALRDAREESGAGAGEKAETRTLLEGLRALLEPQEA